MNKGRLDPASAQTVGSRLKQIQDAKDMQQVVLERASRAGVTPPPYDFLELIGKGSFGRVYKCKHRSTREIVAVKIIDVDELDYTLNNKQKDEAIADFVKEVNTLKAMKDSRAKNVNHIRQGFDLHSQLWIVSDYCSGGSVHTLMKFNEGHGLDEEFIIPIARELAIALWYVHDAGVIHRDIKCGNVLISEDGQLQLCDFGVAAAIESDASKRSTIIGTPYWMAPEMHADTDEGYGKEIDCWAYGCTLFELATGMPPYHNFHPSYLKTVLKSVPRLEEEKYSKDLQDFVAFCLQEKPEDRPTAKEIMEHPYIAGTEKMYPTSSLRNLIDRYVQWERRGGQRMSLFNEMGAAAPQVGVAQAQGPSDDTWIFSTTDDFDKGYEQRYSQIPGGIASMDFADKTPQSLPAEINLPSGPKRILSPLDQAKEDQRAIRGEKYLERLFDNDKNPYDYDTTKMKDEAADQMSDLPLRNMSDERAANRETLIDLDTSGLTMPPTFNFDFSDVPTLKANRKSSMPNLGDLDEDYNPDEETAKRATKDWKFPTFTVSDVDENTKRATKDWKFPAFANTTAGAIENANRRTMDWTFDTAVPLEEDGEDEGVYRPGLVESPRPMLHRNATEPLTTAFDIDEPRQLSIDAALAAQRESRPMIDLDFGAEYQPTMRFDDNLNTADMLRPASPASATLSLTSMGPFDLEQDRLDEPGRDRDGTLRSAASSSSLSIAERRLSRLNRPSKSSFGSHLLPTRTRGSSFDSTASSVVEEETAFGRSYNRSIKAKMSDQLRVGLQRSASSAGRHSRNLTDESYGDIDTDGPYAGDSNGHQMNNSIGTMSYDTDSSYQDESRSVRTPVSFPALSAPNTAALLEGASQDKLLEELDKMLGSAEQALGYTTMVLRKRELGLEGDDGMDKVLGSGGSLDMTSEEERELAHFS